MCHVCHDKDIVNICLIWQDQLRDSWHNKLNKLFSVNKLDVKCETEIDELLEFLKVTTCSFWRVMIA